MILDNNKVPRMEAAEDKPAVVEERKFDAVVDPGEVVVRKQSGIGRFFRQLIAEDLSTCRRTFVDDIVVPFVQDGLSGIFHDGIDLLIYGTKGRRRGRSSGLFGNQKKDYTKFGRSSIFSGSSIRRSRDEDDDDDEEARAYGQNLIIFKSRAKAEDVSNALMDALDQYEAVSVADLYSMAGISNLVGSFTDRNWGWTKINDIKVRRARGGGYTLDLPEPEDIRDLK